jgi:hypothetical protein
LAFVLALNNKANLILYHSKIKLESDIVIGKKTLSAAEWLHSKDQSEMKLIELSDHLKSILTLQQKETIGIAYKQGSGGISKTILNLVEENKIWMVIRLNYIYSKVIMLIIVKYDMQAEAYNGRWRDQTKSQKSHLLAIG